MKVITRESRANDAAMVWKKQYYNEKDKSWKMIDDKKGYPTVDSGNIYEELKGLGANPDPDEVDRIIGNNSWTQVPVCDECGETKQAITLLHNASHRTYAICGMCLLKALNVMEEVSV